MNFLSNNLFKFIFLFIVFVFIITIGRLLFSFLPVFSANKQDPICEGLKYKAYYEITSGFYEGQTGIAIAVREPMVRIQLIDTTSCYFEKNKMVCLLLEEKVSIKCSEIKPSKSFKRD